jgi:transposase
MGAPYAQDLRERILAAYDRGMTTKPIAELFCVSPAWARRVKQRRRESGQITHKPMGGVRIVKIDSKKLRQLVAQQPDATTRELHRRLECRCCESAVGMALRRLGLTFKKRRFMPANRIGPTSPCAARSGRASSPAARRSV